jgi:hypothetical protein
VPSTVTSVPESANQLRESFHPEAPGSRRQPRAYPLEADVVGEGDREGCFGYSFVDAAVLDYDLGFRFLEVDHHGAGGIELYVGGRNYRPVKVGLSAEFGSYHTLFDQDSDFESAVFRIFDECEVFVGEDGFVDSERLSQIRPGS